MTTCLAAEQEDQEELKTAETVVLESERLSKEDKGILDSVHSLATGFLPGVRQVSKMLWPSSPTTQQGQFFLSPTHVLCPSVRVRFVAPAALLLPQKLLCTSLPDHGSQGPTHVDGGTITKKQWVKSGNIRAMS